MTKKLKPSATALNEVTVTIMDNSEKVNYHQTFLMNLAENNSFEFNGFSYNVPAESTMHYSPSFWRFDIKLAVFFDQHKTMARFFDWFNFRKKAVFEVGYLYFSENPEPTSLEAPKIDWALENFKLMNNSTIEASYEDIDNKLRGKKDSSNLLMLIGALIIGAVAIVVIISIMGGGISLGPPPQVANVTAPVVIPSLGGMIK